MTAAGFSPSQRERLEALCVQFHLPTVRAEVVRRFEDAGHQDALAILLEVFELEAQDCKEAAYLTA